MTHYSRHLRILRSASLIALLSAGAAQAVELDMMISGDEEAWKEMVALYGKVAPDVTFKLNIVGYDVVRDQLPVQIAAGTGPDLATVTSLGLFNKYYLDITPYVDAEQWEKNYGAVLAWYRAGKPSGIHGWQSQLTVTGPYVNLTLFDEAGVDVPPPGATWDDWAEATGKVKDKLGLYAGMVMDRSGHRFAGPAISYGAQYITDDGKLVVDDGFKEMAVRMMDWHESGLMPPDIWPAVAGQSYASGYDMFYAQDVPFYMAGSWGLQQINDTVGEDFEWSVVPVPCGPEACAVMPGGTGLVAFASTEYPEEVAAFLDWLSQTENARHFAEITYSISANKTLQTEGIDYESAGAPAVVQEGLNLFSEMASKTAEQAPQAYAIQGDARNTLFFNATINYLGSALNGELTVDEALDKIREEVEAAN